MKKAHFYIWRAFIKLCVCGGCIVNMCGVCDFKMAVMQESINLSATCVLWLWLIVFFSMYPFSSLLSNVTWKKNSKYVNK